MSAIKIKNFKGLIPRKSEEVLPLDIAEVAENCDLRSGSIQPYKATLSVNTPTKAGTKETIYLYAGSFYFHWLTTVHVAEAPLAGDTVDTVYFTGDGAPKMTDSSIATGGGTDYPEGEYLLGIPSPLSAPTVVAPNSTAPTGTITGVSFTGTDSSGNLIGPKVTTSTTGLQAGDSVTISSVAGTTELNGNKYSILSLQGDAMWLDSDEQTFTAYSSGGTWEKVITDFRDVAYVYTYVSTTGEEGPPSAISEVVVIPDGQQVDLSNLLVAPVGAYDIATKNVYRTDSGNNTISLALVATVAIATTTYSDSIRREELGAIIESIGWEPPPSDMKGILALPNGVMVGHTDTEILFSVPYKPHAWPVANRHASPHTIVGIGHFGTTVVITTEETIMLASGYDPQSTTIEDIEIRQSCVSDKSIVNTDLGVMFASPDGLVVVSSSGAKVITENLITKKEWDDFLPSTIDGCWHDKRYYGFYDTGAVSGAFIFDPYDPEKGFTKTDVFATACYKDATTDELYLQVGNDIVQWDSHGSNFLTIDWKSGEAKLPKPMNFAFARIKADAYPVTFDLYADDVQKVTSQSVTSYDPFRLPAGFLAENWQVAVGGTKGVRAVWLGETIEDLQGQV